MILAFHATFATYGLWLPNDSRGSWSDFVRQFELYLTRPATKTIETRPLARRPLDREQRERARAALRYPIVRFSAAQIACVGRGFARAVAESGYVIYACAIFRDHVHMVIERYPGRTIEQIVGHLKTRATQQLTAEGLNPMSQYTGTRGVPSVWVQHGWHVFLNSDREIARSIDYDNGNPQKMGLPPQNWSFVRPWCGSTDPR